MQMTKYIATLEEFENALVAGHFGFVFEENSIREIRRLS